MLNASEVKAERSSEALPEHASARFSEMLISPYMKERLAAARFTTPTPVQAAAIPQALEGKDVLATAQTGTGKPLAFLVPVIKRIVSILPKERQTMCFSATMEGDMARIVKDYLRNAVRLSFGSTSKPSENVRIQAFEVAMDRKQEMLQRLLAKETGKCLVFARTKRGTERIAESLNRKGFSATMIHGDRSQSQRTTALTGFQQGRFRVLVATDLASRGIHVQDIAHVINYDLPEVAENFIHRVGRTGRNGGHGVASTLFVKEQRSELFHLERSLGIKIERMTCAMSCT